MSEFECRYGHLMGCGDIYCRECRAEGRMMERIARMDGMSRYTARKMEEYDYEPNWDKNEEEIDGD